MTGAARCSLAATLLLVDAVAAPVEAQGLDGWSWYGSNTVRAEHYDNGGDAGTAFFPFEGWHAYDELNLNFSRRASAWESVNGYVVGVANVSDYRSAERGLLVERGSVSWEKGDTSLPFRATAGDYFGYLSLRTLQRPLKGMHVELQPTSPAGAQQSVMLMVGADKPAYREFDPTDDLYSAASWLLQTDTGTRLGLNVVHNLRDAGGGSPRREQAVYSVVGEHPFDLVGQRLNLEGELSWLSGDVDTGTGARPDQSEAGYFAQLRGDNRGPLSYRLRFEHYGRDYLPNGASVVPDRRSMEAHAGWRFDSGLQLRGRLQRFRDDYESDNPLDTTTAGLSLGGSVLPGLSSALDAYTQTRENRDGSVDALTRSVSLNAGAALAPRWTARAGAFYQGNDQRGAGSDRITRQLTLGVDHDFRIAGFDALLGPGVILRSVRGGSASGDEYGPTLAFELSRRRHALRLDYSLLRQDRESAVDVLDQRLGVRYAYTRDQHQFGFELDVLGRDPDTAGSSHGNRVSVFYTYSFDRPARALPVSAAARGLLAAPGTGAGAATGVDIATLVPGLPFEQARALLLEADLGAGLQSASRVVYESQLLDGISQRQRLVLEDEGDRLARATLLIDFDDVGDGVNAARTFERVRALLIQRYGRPNQGYERGELGADLAAGVNDGRVARVDEWRTSGGRLRFGIPRRLDGQVRMELQHARSFTSLRDLLWSVSSVR